MTERFPRGDDHGREPVDSDEVARSLAETLDTTGETVELSPERQVVNAAGEIIAHINTEVAASRPDLAPEQIDILTDKAIAEELDKATADPDLPVEGKKQVVVVGIVEEVVHPGVGGETMKELAESDPAIVAKAMETALEGGVDSAALEEIAKSIDKASLDADILTSSANATDSEVDTEAPDVQTAPLSDEYELVGPPEYAVNPEKVRQDTVDRLELPMDIRKGQEIIDLDTGEVRKPAIEVYFDESMVEEVQQNMQERHIGMQQVEDILDAFESFGVQFDESQLDIGRFDDAPEHVKDFLSIKVNTNQFSSDFTTRTTALVAIMRGAHLMPTGIRTEDHGIGGDVVDLYTSPDDLDRLDKISDRMDALVPESYKIVDLPRREIMGARVEACIDAVIPNGEKLVHLVSNNRYFESILRDGRLTPRIHTPYPHEMGASAGHSNLIHFGEAGKINGQYGTRGFAIPIEEIMRQTPYMSQEQQYGSKREDGGMYAQHYGSIRIPVPEDAPLAVKRRVAVLRSRHIDGGVMQTNNGHSNNLSFSASLDLETATDYAYDISGATVVAGYKGEDLAPRKKYIEGLLEDYGYSGEKALDIGSVAMQDDDRSIIGEPLKGLVYNSKVLPPRKRAIMNLDYYTPTMQSRGTIGSFNEKALTDVFLPLPEGLTDEMIEGYVPITSTDKGIYEASIMTRAMDSDRRDAIKKGRPFRTNSEVRKATSMTQEEFSALSQDEREALIDRITSTS